MDNRAGIGHAHSNGSQQQMQKSVEVHGQSQAQPVALANRAIAQNEKGTNRIIVLFVPYLREE